MAKSTLSFVCQNCGAAYNRLAGQVRFMRPVEQLAEEDTTSATRCRSRVRSRRKGRTFALESLTGKSNDAPRLPSGMTELDRVTGGGFVRGSVLFGRRRPRHRQVDLADAGHQHAGRAGHRADLYFGRRGRGAGCGCARAAGACGRTGAQLAAETSSKTSSRRCRRARCRADRDRFDPDHVDRHGGIRAGTVTQVRASAQALIRFARNRELRSFWSDTSPRTARSQAPAWSSTWSTRCCHSRAKARNISGFCAQ